jgi:hypothetical protein
MGRRLLLLAAPWAMAQTTFNYTGAVQTYTIPAGAGGITIVANGGAAAAPHPTPRRGGNGGARHGPRPLTTRRRAPSSMCLWAAAVTRAIPRTGTSRLHQLGRSRRLGGRRRRLCRRQGRRGRLQWLFGRRRRRRRRQRGCHGGQRGAAGRRRRRRRPGRRAEHCRPRGPELAWCPSARFPAARAPPAHDHRRRGGGGGGGGCPGGGRCFRTRQQRHQQHHPGHGGRSCSDTAWA